MVYAKGPAQPRNNAMMATWWTGTAVLNCAKWKEASLVSQSCSLARVTNAMYAKNPSAPFSLTNPSDASTRNIQKERKISSLRRMFAMARAFVNVLRIIASQSLEEIASQLDEMDGSRISRLANANVA
jgi:hypothetical protein